MEAIIYAAESDTLLSEAELKKQELKDARSLVEDAKQQLKSESLKCFNKASVIIIFNIQFSVLFSDWFCHTGVSDGIDERKRQLKEVKDEKNNIKVVFLWHYLLFLVFVGATKIIEHNNADCGRRL